ncbi:heparan-alpha-glucosaminide N-acetyltransferase domain-containing protein, partial [Acinetobacter baumannii]|uniref:heparan-alpha-glucosaminide N-acetyltransferase domain-containing protein n=1 Tax=Acinetobacter baumannii TaxID=470 RepID=UPI003AF9FA17
DCCVVLNIQKHAGVALVIIFGHNLLDSVHFSQRILQNIWFVLHERGWLEFAGIKRRTSYPVLPWSGVILLGYVVGQFFSSKYSANQR